LWPTKEENNKFTPIFDELFETFKKSEYLKKAMTYIDNIIESLKKNDTN